MCDDRTDKEEYVRHDATMFRLLAVELTAVNLDVLIA